MKKYYFVSYHDENKKDEIICSEERPDMGKLGLFMLSIPYDSEEELIKHEGLRTDCKCKMCGNWIKTSYTNYDEFKDLNICYNCNHWNRIYLTKDREERFIIEGTSYWKYPDAPNAHFQGFGGREFKIQRFGKSKVIVTRNLWCQGTLPTIWRELVPDNAKFVK